MTDPAAESAWDAWYATYAGRGDNALRWTAAIILRKAFLAGYDAGQESGVMVIRPGGMSAASRADEVQAAQRRRAAD